MPIWRFGAFELDPDAGEVRKRGYRLRVREQTFRVLVALVGNAGRVVTRDELRHHLWPDGTFVNFDRAINKAINELRRVLGDSASCPRFVETLSKRGYRFLGSVESVSSLATAWLPRDPRSDARLAYVTGRYLWNRRTVRDLHASIGHFERALEIDDAFAVAHTGVADVQALFGIWGLLPPDRAFGAARHAARRALDRDPSLPEAHTSLAIVLSGYEFDWRRAESRYRHAISLRPHYATAHQWYAQMLVSLGRYSDAVFHIEQARCADPVSPAITSFLPCIHLCAREYGRALEEAQRAVDLEPYAPLAHWYLGRVYLFSNRAEDAVRTLEYGGTLVAGASMWTAELIYARARAGDHSGAMRLLSELVERGRCERVSPYDLAIAFVGVGDHVSALDQLEQAFDEREMRMTCVGDPEFDVLRATARYRRLLERLRLPGITM